MNTLLNAAKGGAHREQSAVDWAEEFRMLWVQTSERAQHAWESTQCLEEMPPRAGYVLVAVRNYDHVLAAFGQEFAEALIQGLSWRLYAWGATIIQMDRRHLLACPARQNHCAGRDDLAPVPAHVLELWQIGLAGKPFSYKGAQAAIAVSVDSVDIQERCGAGGSFAVFDSVLHRKTPAPNLAPPNSGWDWRTGYRRDMGSALTFLTALAREQICLALQPVVSGSHLVGGVGDAWTLAVPRSAILYHEALVRFDTPTDDPVLSPGVFVPAMERLGLVHLLDHLVLKAALCRLQEDTELCLGCNVSASSLAPHGGWWDGILECLHQQPGLAARLTIEITETAPLPDYETSVMFVHKLRALGCHIAIDDFGVGHTRMDFIRAVKPQVIKLSGHLTQLAAESEVGLQELSSVARFAATLAPVVVAEGVSGQAQCNAARHAGVGWVQGFGVTRPSLAQPRLALGVSDALDTVA